MKEEILRHLCKSLGKDAAHSSVHDWRVALSLALRDRMVDHWFRSTRETYETRAKRVYYLSMEFLIGRLVEDMAANLGLVEEARAALTELGQDYDAVVLNEPDAALGNGGLGRLAACFMDLLASLGIPAYGYGIRYEHGLFKQDFVDGRQVETAETWLTQRNPWEFERPEVQFRIGFGGHVDHHDGKAYWHPWETVLATAYDTPVVGWQGKWGNTLRLWSARPASKFDLESFNRGDYLAAGRSEALARTISRVLYPDDTTEAGKELRLKQEYFFTAASIMDLLRRFLSDHDDIRELPQYVAIQLNDTHPAIAGPELVRLMSDEHNLPMDEAIELARRCLGYTNHTLLPEALERWHVGLLGRVLPRHLEIIRAIDEDQQARHPGSPRILEHDHVHMGELAFIMAHKVNGVSALHTELVKSTVFSDLHRIHPTRIVNQTNGITPRRWLHTCNAPLSNLITREIGDGWVADLEKLKALNQRTGDREFLDAFSAAKRQNKTELADWIAQTCGIAVDPDAMFDVQIKRIHEYKRQLMNILETVALWNEMRDAPDAEWTPRVKIFGGKAAPGYHVAKQIIHLINDVARVINNDPVTGDLLKVVFPANYNVTMAERLIPAADLSEQISTAGKEASGTGNMKFALNGALTIGTLDGANVEIREHVGSENFFLFGLTAREVVERRHVHGYARAAIEASPRLSRVLGQIADGQFSPEDSSRYHGLVGGLYDHDYFLVTCDFDSYFDTQRRADQVYRNGSNWAAMALRNTASMGWFSSDRTIRGYARDIWQVDAVDRAGLEMTA
ncbi:glycogen/starch/alpha-glucan phosphorylase [Roseibium salinum]|uniref:Alpha-1,4 glucan phosphorylase n=1 Tax=Roseibium salinum TaxID=1604349 RepID=A0ABT3R8U6_9HYPH|nr:glycogen/starch/alpha-glucan phosphorylase [Roseibium sp. DSM 29163]MCX2725688.1 glycogen/starch/alpha-glucan phosphorylase [Roseibium sp. DSM 29163]